MQVLSSLSDELAGLVESAGRSVVRVEGRRRLPASGIVWSADGVIVTAHHVVEREEHIAIGLPGGETAAATLVGRDPTTDVAVLRLSGAPGGLAAAAWAALDSARVGHMVLALGRPGQSVQATLGIISALGGTWRTPAGGRLSRYLQTDVVMYPGFSGGPLVTTAAEGAHVLGLTTSALLPGVSLAVPADSLREVVDTLLAHGRVRRGYLGVGAQPVRLPAALANQLGQDTAVLIMSVSDGSPAERGGLLLGDTIVAVGGDPVRRMEDLQAALGGDRAGSNVPVRVVRGGHVQELSVVIGERD
jgi:S1-C subfamily serine protease